MRREHHRLDRTLASLVKQAPGGVILVERGGRVVFHQAYGLADVENGAPVHEDAVFCIGSISKQFGAAAVMQLVEAGKLRLDDKLARFFPDFPRADRITVDDLLHQTTGIVDFEYNGGWPKTMAVERTDDELVATFRDLPPEFEPGARWAYSTSNYFLVGMIVEKASGVPLAKYLAERVFAPAGLTHTRFCDAHALIPKRAVGYDVDEQKGFIPTRPTILTQFGVGGGLCSTVHDLLTWQHALEGGKVVSAESYRKMRTAAPLPDGTPTGYGYGLFPSDFYGHPVISHSGGVAGYSAFLVEYPADDLRIVMAFNTEGAPMTAIERSLALSFLGITPPKPQPIRPAELQRYAVATKEMAFVVDGDHLAVKLENRSIPLVYLGNQTFEAVNGARVIFEVQDGRVVGFATDHGHMRMFFRL